MRGEVGGEDQGSEGGDGESVNTVDEEQTAISQRAKQSLSEKYIECEYNMFQTEETSIQS